MTNHQPRTDHYFDVEECKLLEKLGLECGTAEVYVTDRDHPDWGLVPYGYLPGLETVPAFSLLVDIIGSPENCKKIWPETYDHSGENTHCNVCDGMWYTNAINRLYEIQEGKLDQAKAYVIDAAKKRLEEMG